MILSHRIALDPTLEQRIALARACGVARFTWNWALAEWNRQYAAGEKPTALKLKKAWNDVKHEKFPWISESPKDANQQPFTNLGKAFNGFFRKLRSRPSFKKRGVHDSFYVSNDLFSVDAYTVRLPVVGSVRLMEPLRFAGKVMSGAVSREADRWFLSVTVDVGDDYKREPSVRPAKAVGIDLGLKVAVVTSNGESFDAPKPLRRYIKTLRRRSRQHSRKQKGSNSKRKSAMRLARLHRRIKNIRKDWTNKVTTQIVAKTKLICIEDLNVKGMTANHKMARALNDVGFGDFRRQLEYKAPLYGHRVVVINRWLPTSLTCSACGVKKESLSLSERVFHCDHCGVEIDRDLNAAKNILAAGLAVSACGPEGSGCARKRTTKPCRVEAGTR